jgi:hypothetical protein
MNVGLVTIAALLLLLPGVGLVVGVNFADKNVRETVFRNTLAEIGYILVVSLVVHLFYACLSLAFACLSGFNAAHLYTQYLRLNPPPNSPVLPISDPEALRFLILSLVYYLAGALTGFVAGLGLGRLIRRRFRHPLGKWFVSFFVKHRWMLQLIQRDDELAVYAAVMLKDTFAHLEKLDAPTVADQSALGATGSKPEAAGGKPGAPKYEKIDHRVVIQGVIKDCYCESDGTLLYLVFDANYEIRRADGVKVKYLDGMNFDFTASNEQLFVEGKNIALVHFASASLPAGDVLKAFGEPTGL